jgi:CO/xanthine dehydrogenase Mo-binding subunit
MGRRPGPRHLAEIGGGFGGKTVVYLEPIALALSQKAGRPVKMVMTREEVFRASGPTSGAHVRVKIGAKKDGRIVAAEAELKYQAGAFAGSPVQPGCMCAYAPYDLENVKVVGYDVVTNRPKVAAYRAPGGPISEFAVESVIDEIAGKIGMDPIELRLKNAAKQGTKAAYGPKFGPIGMIETLEAAKAHAHWRTPLAKNQGRGVASGFWFNIGGETSVSLQLNEDGTLSLTAGTPDIGGLRASLCMMAAEELGVELGRDPRPDRRHRPARLQLPHRRQPRHLLERHGDGGGRARGHEGSPASAPPSCGSCRRTPSSTRTARCVPPGPTPASTTP